MAWTSPKTWVADEIVDQTELNAYMRDNQNFLLSGRAQGFAYRTSAYSLTSVNMTAIDSTNLKATLVPASTRILVVAAIELFADNTAGNYGAFTVGVTGTWAGDASYGLATLGQNTRFHVCAGAIFTGLTPGNTYNCLPAWRAGTAGGSVQIQANRASWVFAMEF